MHCFKAVSLDPHIGLTPPALSGTVSVILILLVCVCVCVRVCVCLASAWIRYKYFHSCDVVVLHFHCAPLAQCIWLRRWFSCPSFPLVDDPPTKAEEHPLSWLH